MENEKTYGERIKETITEPSVRVVPISFPGKTYKRFSKWAEKNAGNCFWLAFERLLDKEELVSVEEFLLYQQETEAIISELQSRINELSEKKTTKVFKTFGRKEEL